MHDYILLVDFDETITVTDTLSFVAAAGYETNSISQPWAEFGNAYMADYNKFTEQYKPESRTSIASELAALEAVESVELASVANVERSGLFKGVTHAALTKQAQNVQVRPGVSQVLQLCARSKGVNTVSIISVNWSSLFICEVLKQTCGVSASAANKTSSDDAVDVTVYSNEIEMDELGRGTGSLQDSSAYNLRTGAHKASILRQIQNEQHGKTIYLGDSTGDLAPLLEADLGVIVGQKKSLRETCARIGVKIEPFKSLPRGEILSNINAGSDEKVLFALDHWYELLSYGPLAEIY
ncbi:HAD-like domain-containing protein [Kockiozyma suomiensis]|uniref:HAD-like domain-containing protein n=1 Tax=Kockiozyma suomiensis TaxID=1337062 RepID=UPI003343BABF